MLTPKRTGLRLPRL